VTLQPTQRYPDWVCLQETLDFNRDFYETFTRIIKSPFCKGENRGIREGILSLTGFIPVLVKTVVSYCLGVICASVEKFVGLRSFLNRAPDVGQRLREMIINVAEIQFGNRAQYV